MARLLCEKAAAGSPGTLGTQEQVVGGVLAVALPCRHHRSDRSAQNRKAEHSALKCTTRQFPKLRVSLLHLPPLCIPADELNTAGAEVNVGVS